MAHHGTVWATRLSVAVVCLMDYKHTDTSVPQWVLHAESLDASQSSSNVQSVGAITYTWNSTGILSYFGTQVPIVLIEQILVL